MALENVQMDDDLARRYPSTRSVTSAVLAALDDGPKTIYEISEITGLDPRRILTVLQRCNGKKAKIYTHRVRTGGNTQKPSRWMRIG